MFTVHIEDDFAAFRLRVFLVERENHHARLHRGDGRIEEINPNQRIADDTGAPILNLPRDAAPALLAALSRQLGAVEHPEQLRRDYDAERARVDKFIDHYLREGI